VTGYSPLLRGRPGAACALATSDRPSAAGIHPGGDCCCERGTGSSRPRRDRSKHTNVVASAMSVPLCQCENRLTVRRKRWAVPSVSHGSAAIVAARRTIKLRGIDRLGFPLPRGGVSRPGAIRGG
jgi:hypothetical protein